MLRTAIAWMMLVVPGVAMSAEPVKGEVKKEPVKVTIHGYDWNGAIPEKAIVVVNNPYGDIRARNHGENKIFMHATYQKLGEYPLEPEFVMKEKEGKWYIDVRYEQNIRYKTGDLRGRADIAILFPEHVKIEAKTDFGLIKVDRSSSDVIAVSRSGDIKLTTTGQFDITTANGNIGLKLRGFKQTGQSNAKTETGKIKAEIFSDMDLALNAHTKKGRIEENGKATKENRHTYSFGNIQAKVALNSDSGNISLDIVQPPELVKSVKPETAEQDLRALPKAEQWKPGDPVVDRDDKINYNKSSRQPNG